MPLSDMELYKLAMKELGTPRKGVDVAPTPSKIEQCLTPSGRHEFSKDAVSFSIEQNLRDIYYDPARGFQSKERLYHRAREEGLGVTRKMVDEWLKEQDAYTRYKPIVRKLPS